MGGKAETFIKGNLNEFDPSGGEIICSVYIPTTPLAIVNSNHRLYPDGTIYIENPDEKREGIKWNTKYGVAELTNNYIYADEDVGIDKAMLRIQRCQIILKIKSKEIVSLKLILQELSQIFDDTLWLLSLLSRRRITWYAGEAVYLPGNNSQTKNFKKAFIHRERHLGYEGTMGFGEHEIDLLITADTLRGQLFQTLLTSYNSSRYKETIQQAIIYVLMTYERSYLEAYIGIIYLALETLISGLGGEIKNKPQKLLKPSEFKKLRKILGEITEEEIKDSRKYQEIVNRFEVLNRPIHSNILETNLFSDLCVKFEKAITQNITDPKKSHELTSRLKELNRLTRPPIIKRLMALLERYEVPIAKLWPPETNIELELSKIINRRDLYIHKGEITDIEQSLYDFARLRNLVELWILKILGYPDEAINWLGLINVMPIDRK